MPSLPSDVHEYLSGLIPFVVEHASDFDLLSELQRRNRRRGDAKGNAVPHLSRYLAAFVEQHYAAMPALKSALVSVRGAQLRALEAITL